MIPKQLAAFVNRNIVLVVMIPSLIAAHWGWWKLQQVDEFVRPEERNPLPIIDATKKISEVIKSKIVSPENVQKSDE